MSVDNAERKRGDELVGIGARPLRDLGNCIGFSLDRDDLERAGIIDENGDVPEQTSVSYRIYEDGSLEAKIDE
jgi:hypothetical protein